MCQRKEEEDRGDKQEGKKKVTMRAAQQRGC